MKEPVKSALAGDLATETKKATAKVAF